MGLLLQKTEQRIGREETMGRIKRRTVLQSSAAAAVSAGAPPIIHCLVTDIDETASRGVPAGKAVRRAHGEVARMPA